MHAHRVTIFDLAQARNYISVLNSISSAASTLCQASSTGSEIPLRATIRLRAKIGVYRTTYELLCT